MKTEEYILVENTDIDLDKITIPDYTEDEMNVIKKLLEFTRHFQEINQLYDVFNVNLHDILIHYVLNANDTICRKTFFNEDDLIVINALIINYISSAKTLVESIEIFLKQNLGERFLNDFKDNCISLIYDKYFSYRLLIRLRDYAQHGHLPVYINDNKCCFDLNQILNTPHYNHNKKIKNEIDKISEDIENKFRNNPRIVFTRSIAEFQICILEIYLKFIDQIRETALEIVENFKNLLKNRPEIIYKSGDILNGFIIFFMEDSDLHVLNPNDDSIKMIDDIRFKIKKRLSEERKEFKKIFKKGR